MREDPVLVLFCGGMGGSAVEDALGGALRASRPRHLLERALAGGAYDGAIVVADAASADAFEGQLPAGVMSRCRSRRARRFHFGRRLTEVIQRYELATPRLLRLRPAADQGRRAGGRCSRR